VRKKALYLDYAIQLALIAYPNESMVLFTVHPNHILIGSDISTCSALGSYVAVVLALEALLYSALSLVSLALEDLALPDQALVNNLVGILWLAELYNNAGRGLCGCVACQPPNVLDLCLRDERRVV
jgi:hypothetical protein